MVNRLQNLHVSTAGNGGAGPNIAPFSTLQTAAREASMPRKYKPAGPEKKRKELEFF